MQLGEMNARALESLAVTKPCWFCQSKKAKGVDNVLKPNPPDTNDEDEVPENDPENNLKNDSATLGGRLTKAGKKHPSVKIACPIEDCGTEDVISGAHHLIPGNASLKKANQLLPFINRGIGYNVNGALNGVWLPGNYGVKTNHERWGKIKEKYGDDYACRAMRQAAWQFHDAHPAYSDNVLNTLNTIGAKLKDGSKGGKCPVCGEKIKGGTKPYGLVRRLNRVSDLHRKLLVLPSLDVEMHDADDAMSDGGSAMSDGGDAMSDVGDEDNPALEKARAAVNNDYYTSSRVFVYLGLERPE